jgi:hypothetical protein
VRPADGPRLTGTKLEKGSVSSTRKAQACQQFTAPRNLTIMRRPNPGCSLRTDQAPPFRLLPVLQGEQQASTFHSQSAAIIDPIEEDGIFSGCEVFIDGQLLSLVVAVIVEDENAAAD